jgi:hypothetical protein
VFEALVFFLEDLHCLVWNCGRFFLLIHACHWTIQLPDDHWQCLFCLYYIMLSLLASSDHRCSWSFFLFFVEWCSPVSMWHLSLFLQRACRSVCSWQVNSAAFHNFTMQMKTNWRWDELLPLHATNQLHLHHMLNAPIPVWKHDFDMYNNSAPYRWRRW